MEGEETGSIVFRLLNMIADNFDERKNLNSDLVIDGHQGLLYSCYF